MFETVKTKNTLKAEQICDTVREVSDCDLANMRLIFAEADKLHQGEMKRDGRSMALLQLIDAIAYLKFGGQWRVVNTAPKPHKRHSLGLGLLLAMVFGGHHHGRHG